jgi:hypothetical protein
LQKGCPEAPWGKITSKKLFVPESSFKGIASSNQYFCTGADGFKNFVPALLWTHENKILCFYLLQ